MSERRHIAIVGAGPAGLMAAEAAAERGAQVTIYDRMPSPARKFLMAGRGGLNLTHSEDLSTFLSRYGAASDRLRPFIEDFPPQALRAWAEALGEPTFVGSSGRVFPKSFKASPLLRAWLRRLAALGVELKVRHRLTGFDGSTLHFEAENQPVTAEPDATVLAFGGASWPRLGSDGRWADLLSAHGVRLSPLLPANAGVEITWSGVLRERFAGQPIKPMTVTFGGRSVKGEAVLTDHGLEGGAIYALSAAIRDALGDGREAQLVLDLRPDLTHDALTRRLSAERGKQSTASVLRKAGGLTPIAAALLREAGPLPTGADEMARRIKQLTLPVRGIRPLDRAISTAGGVKWDSLGDGLGLKGRPGVFVAGEMLDWEAPTGGYLLQACFATGRAAGIAAALHNPAL